MKALANREKKKQAIQGGGPLPLVNMWMMGPRRSKPRKTIPKNGGGVPHQWSVAEQGLSRADRQEFH